MDKLRIVADENIPALQECFSDIATIEALPGRDLLAADLARADVLLVRSVTTVDENLLAGSPVKFIGTATSGFNHVDRDYLASRDIAFALAAGANANSVVEYVLCAIAATGTKLDELLSGGSLGIVGYGHIGRALAARAQLLGITVRVYDPWLDTADITAASSLDDVLACDVVSLHCELTRQAPWPSHHLLSHSELAWLAPDTLLINASRGEVVDGAALLERCTQAPSLTVVLDVWESEPRIDTALLEKVSLATAHIAGYSLDGKVGATRMLRQALAHAFDLQAEEAPQALSPSEALKAPADLGDAGLLRQLLQRSYDIHRDDRLLRDACTPVDADTRAEAFDALRKHYGIRRELAGRCVDVANLSGEQRKLVEALVSVPAGPV